MFLHLFVILFTVATEAGGTHPTGMHTCVEYTFDVLYIVYQYLLYNKDK